MRVTWVSYEFGEYCIRHVNALVTEHDVQLILPTQEIQRYSEVVDPRVETFLFDRPRLRHPIRQILAIRRIMKAITNFSPAVIHLQSGHLWFNLALPFLRKYPLVVTIHDPTYHEGDENSRKTPHAVMAFGYRRADRVIVHGPSLVGPVRRMIHLPMAKIHVVAHVAVGGITNLARFDEDADSVLFFGRIWEYKGLEYLIKAEPLISKHRPDFRVIIAGEGEELARYRRMMVHPERFIIHNTWIDDDQRTELFQRAAIVVLPYISATQSGVVPLAHSFAKPVVATSVGALPDVIEHGASGLLVPPRDEHALAEAILELLGNEQLRREMGRRGQERLDTDCAPAVVACRTAEVYAEAIRDRRG